MIVEEEVGESSDTQPALVVTGLFPWSWYPQMPSGEIVPESARPLSPVARSQWNNLVSSQNMVLQSDNINLELDSISGVSGRLTPSSLHQISIDELL